MKVIVAAHPDDEIIALLLQFLKDAA